MHSLSARCQDLAHGIESRPRICRIGVVVSVAMFTLELSVTQHSDGPVGKVMDHFPVAIMISAGDVSRPAV